ncbi:MAG: hypothetical protein JWN32_4458 [Solirubrobacterales bacterium]|nr:hypothetical protein [Solirubrobacterales bacterium]
MDPVTVSVTIARPREEVFAYLGDIANHPEFTDHFLTDWRLTRVDSYGQGAGARFKVDAPLNRFSWADLTFVEFEPPHRIVERGRGGKFNRIRQVGVWTLTAGPGDTTDVELTLETEPRLPSDRVMELLAGRSWFKRKHRKALRRLRTILEEGRGRGHRATIAGG